MEREEERKRRKWRKRGKSVKKKVERETNILLDIMFGAPKLIKISKLWSSLANLVS